MIPKEKAYKLVEEKQSEILLSLRKLMLNEYRCVNTFVKIENYFYYQEKHANDYLVPLLGSAIGGAIGFFTTNKFIGTIASTFVGGVIAGIVNNFVDNHNLTLDEYDIRCITDANSNDYF